MPASGEQGPQAQWARPGSPERANQTRALPRQATSARRQAEVGGGGTSPSAAIASIQAAKPANVSDTPSDATAAASHAEMGRLLARQVADQLSPNTPFGRQLTRQMSEYFGQPVVFRVKPAALGSGGSGASQPVAPPENRRARRRR